MTWDGEQPSIGQYLFTARGRIYYLILEMKRPQRSAAYTFMAICERRPRSEMADHPAFEFQWNKR